MTSGSVRISLTSGETFEVQPGETVLAAAQRAGVFIPYSCQSGTCRTCISLVVSGDVRHDPEYEDDLLIHEDDVAEGRRLLCSSLAYSDSLIDVGG